MIEELLRVDDTGGLEELPNAINLEGLATLLNLPLPTIYKIVRERDKHDNPIPGVKCGKQWRFLTSQILDWLNLNKPDTSEIISPKFPEIPEIMDIKQLAELLRLPLPTTYTLARERDKRENPIPGQKCGKQWRFKKSQVLHWLNSSRPDIALDAGIKLKVVPSASQENLDLDPDLIQLEKHFDSSSMKVFDLFNCQTLGDLFRAYTEGKIELESKNLIFA